MNKRFYCEHCKYSTDKLCNFTRHNNTKKHNTMVALLYTALHNHIRFEKVYNRVLIKNNRPLSEFF